MAFEYKNARGITYYLHKTQVTLKGSGRQQTIYYFSKKKGTGALDELPTGFKVKETDRSNLPVLKKK